MIVIYIIVIVEILNAQTHNVSSIGSTQEPVVIPFLEISPKIDGVLSEGEWSDAYSFSGYFTQIDPDFGKKIKEKTVVKIGYVKNSIFVLFEVYQAPGTLIERKGTRTGLPTVGSRTRRLGARK